MPQTAPRRIPSLSVEDYLCLEQGSSVKHEYVAGQVYALAGASERHNRIAGNIFARLWIAAGDGPCRVYGSDMRLRVGDDVVYYPDVQVVCDSADVEQNYKSLPCIIIEVLSPSTMSIDLREKLLACRRIDSLKTYVIVYRDERRVLRHFRDDAGAWWDAEVLGEGRVRIPCPELELTLADIYRGVAPTG